MQLFIYFVIYVCPSFFRYLCMYFFICFVRSFVMLFFTSLCLAFVRSFALYFFSYLFIALLMCSLVIYVCISSFRHLGVSFVRYLVMCVFRCLFRCLYVSMCFVITIFLYRFLYFIVQFVRSFVRASVISQVLFVVSQLCISYCISFGMLFFRSLCLHFFSYVFSSFVRPLFCSWFLCIGSCSVPYFAMSCFMSVFISFGVLLQAVRYFFMCVCVSCVRSLYSSFFTYVCLAFVLSLFRSFFIDVCLYSPVCHVFLCQLQFSIYVCRYLCMELFCSSISSFFLIALDSFVMSLFLQLVQCYFMFVQFPWFVILGYVVSGVRLFYVSVCSSFRVSFFMQFVRYLCMYFVISFSLPFVMYLCISLVRSFVMSYVLYFCSGSLCLYLFYVVRSLFMFVCIKLCRSFVSSVLFGYLVAVVRSFVLLLFLSLFI